MNNILAHICNHRTYLPLLQQLNKKVPIISGSLHKNIFDTFHKHQPTTIILPIFEYTQEFHQFVDTFKDKVNIVIFMGDIIHNDVIEYCDKFKIKTIRQNASGSETTVEYKHIYDSTSFINAKAVRNNKILTILHSNNDINHKLLDSIIYPKTKTKLVLINNPEFHHAQNVGVANSSDVAILFNKFAQVLDLTTSYSIEAQACGIDNISLEGDILKNITELTFVPQEENIQQYSMENFINNQLLKLIEV
ncbi:MAG: hypothetical protein WD512_00645 [Candidatus Paceibacterota bacterium]